MKKFFAFFVITAILCSTFTVYGIDVIKKVGYGETIVLPSTIEDNGIQKLVRWDRTKFKAATKGVIHVTGITPDSEDVNLYIVVGYNKATVTVNDSEINFNDKTGKFSAAISGSENEFASLFIFKKEDVLSDLDTTYTSAAPVFSETTYISDGVANFNVDLSKIFGGNYVAYISSGSSVDSDEFEYVNYDEFLIKTKEIEPSDLNRGQKLVDLCSQFYVLMTYNLYPVYTSMSNDEKISVMEKIPQRIRECQETVDLDKVLFFMNEEVALYKLKNSTDACVLLDDKVNLYAKALGVDVSDNSYYSQIAGKGEFSKYLLSKDLSNVQKVQSAFYKGVGLVLINEATRANIKTRLENLDKINGVLSLDISEELESLGELSETLQEEIYSEIAVITNFKETTEVKTKLQELIPTEENDDPDDPDDPDSGAGVGGSGGLGGAGSGGSGGGVSDGGLGNYGGNAAIADSTKGESNNDEPSKINAFEDISDAEWARIYINKLSQLDVISGFDNKIRPNDPITREEFAKLIVNALNLTETADNMSFSDVNPNEWYAEYISKLYKSGITTGINSTQFGIGNYISREDMTVLTYRAIKYAGMAKENLSSEDKFVDDSEISEYAKEAVYALKMLGVVNGMEDKSYMPKAVSSRAMAFKVICEAFYK